MLLGCGAGVGCIKLVGKKKIFLCRFFFLVFSALVSVNMEDLDTDMDRS